MIKLVVPENLNHIAGDLEKFFGGMIQKLSENGHKGLPGQGDISSLYGGMMEEIEEAFEQFVLDKKDPNMLLELCDISNYSFLFYLAINRKDSDGRSEAGLETAPSGAEEA